MTRPDVAIAGAGIIGLSLALELHHRGLTVTVLDRAAPLSEASTAAAGMLAVDDPDNPPDLHALAQLSRSLYPAFLDHLHALSPHRVPFQTTDTLQSLPAHPTHLAPLTLSDLHRHLPALDPGPLTFTLLTERSLDPRDLATALLASVLATAGIDLRPHTPVVSLRPGTHSVQIETPIGIVDAGRFVDCTGAWSVSAPFLPHLPVTPRKGQMLSVQILPTLALTTVVRTPSVYVVPRTVGPNAGRALIGATVEDVGFHKSVDPAAIARLHAEATSLLPPLAGATVLEAWSGLRPSTPDRLPILGPLTPATSPSLCFVASGHFRNGILLAPATAQVMAQLLTGDRTAVDLAPFSPQRSPPGTAS